MNILTVTEDSILRPPRALITQSRSERLLRIQSRSGPTKISSFTNLQTPAHCHKPTRQTDLEVRVRKRVALDPTRPDKRL